MAQKKKYDKERLKQAVILCLDAKYGQTRTDRVRAFLKGEVENKTHRLHPFRNVVEPLNELLDAGRTFSMSRTMRLLDLADKHRERLAKLAIADKGEEELREKRRAYLIELRNRKTAAVRIEEIRLGRKLSEAEREKFLEEAMRRWNIRREKYIREHVEMNRREATAAFTKELEAELELKLARALAAGPVKQRSTVSIESKRKDEGKQARSDWRGQLSDLRKKLK